MRKYKRLKLTDEEYSKYFEIIKEIMREGLWDTKEVLQYYIGDNYEVFDKCMDNPIIAEQIERLTPYLIKINLLVNRGKVKPHVKRMAEKFKIDYNDL